MNPAALYNRARGLHLAQLRLYLVQARPEAIRTFTNKEIAAVLKELYLTDESAYLRVLPHVPTRYITD